METDSESEGTTYPSPPTSPRTRLPPRSSQEEVSKKGAADAVPTADSPLLVQHMYGLDEDLVKSQVGQTTDGGGEPLWRPYAPGALHKPSMYDELRRKLEMDAAVQAGTLIDGQPISPPDQTGEIGGRVCPPPPKKNNGGGKTSTPMDASSKAPRISMVPDKWRVIHEEGEEAAGPSQSARAEQGHDTVSVTSESSPDVSPARKRHPAQSARRERRSSVSGGAPPEEMPPLERIYTEEEVRRLLTEQAVTLTERSMKKPSPQAESLSPIPTVSDMYTHRLLEKLNARQDEVEQAKKKKQEEEVMKKEPLALETYAGKDTEDWFDYHSNFEEIAKWNGWTDEQKRQQLAVHLTGHALSVNTDNRPTTYAELVALLKKNFTPVDGVEGYKSQFRTTTLDDFPDPRMYSQRLTRLARRAFPNYDQVALDGVILDQFKDGLTGTELCRHVAMGKFDTLAKAEEVVGRHQRLMEREKKKKLPKPKPDSAVPRLAMSTSQHVEEETEADRQPLTKTIHDCVVRAMQSVSNTQQSSNNGGGYSRARQNGGGSNARANLRRKMICWVCSQEGHGFQQCPSNRDGHFHPSEEQQKRVDAARERNQRQKLASRRNETSPTNASPSAHSLPPEPLN